MKRLIINDPGEIGLKLHGERYATYRKRLAEADRYEYYGEFPIQVDFDTVDACNLDCPVCADRGRTRTGKKLNVAGACAVIDEGAEKGLYAINIGAIGEPFLNKKALFEVVRHAREKGIMDIFVHTNFQLPSHDDIKQLVDSGCTVLSLSVDAASAGVYEKTRGGDFAKLLDNVRFLKKYKEDNKLLAPVVRISSVPCSLNVDEMHGEFFDFWKELADVVEIQGFQKTDFQADGLNVLKKQPPFGCSTAFWRLIFWPTSVAACCGPGGLNDDLLLTRDELGSYSVSELWTGEKLQKIRENVKSGNWKAMPSCIKCFKSIYLWED